jgi:hypothetical protein
MSEYLLLRHDRPARGEQYGQKVERTAADFDRSSVTKEQTRARKQLKAPEPNRVFARISSEGRISPDGLNLTVGSRPKRWNAYRMRAVRTKMGPYSWNERSLFSTERLRRLRWVEAGQPVVE